MKILFPSVFYLPQAVGGIEYYIHNLARGLVSKGHIVKIVVPAFEDYDHNMNDYEIDGLQVIRYTGFGPADKLEITGIKPNKSLDNFKELLAREKPDIVHFSQLTNSSGISLQHIHAARQSGAKVVYTNHLAEFICQRGDLKYMGTTDCDGNITVKKCTTCLLNKRGLNKTLIKLVPFFDGIAARIVGTKNYTRQVSPVMFPGFATRWHINKIESVIAMCDSFVSIAGWNTALMKQNNWYKNNCTTINTGLFHSNPALINKQDFNGNRPLKIIFIGRIVPVKGLDVLIKAVVKMDKTKIQVDIYGPKGHGTYVSYIDHCKRLAAENDNISFNTQVDNTQVVKLMSEYDILCLPSKGIEMAPLVIQEAMAAGIPVVGADLPAIKEWVADGSNGFVFRVNDHGQLREKLQQLVDEPGLLEKFKKNLQQPNSFKEVVNRYNELYQSFFIKN